MDDDKRYTGEQDLNNAAGPISEEPSDVCADVPGESIPADPAVSAEPFYTPSPEDGNPGEVSDVFGTGDIPADTAGNAEDDLTDMAENVADTKTDMFGNTSDTQTGTDENTADTQTEVPADAADTLTGAAEGAAETDIPAEESIPPQDRPHDFDVDEPKFDTQTGEPLDKPKKKYPGVILTFVVTAAALGAFIYSVMPGKLPSSGNIRDDGSGNEIMLAIASTEAEETESMSQNAETEKDMVRVETEDGEVILSAAAAQTETEAAAQNFAETETETEELAQTESETEAETGTKTKEQIGPVPESDGEEKQKKGEPEFKTEGVILSATLDVSDMVEEVMPGIVSITCTNIKTVQDFFYGKQEIRQTDAGSGIIVDEDDEAYYIVTDAWIVSGADELTVGFSVSREATKELSDEDTLAQAEVIGMDRDTELAMLRVVKDDVNEVIRGQVGPSVIGDSDAVRVGERAIAIGNAMGYGLSVTEGIISALDRQMSTGAGTHSYIQTDASINYGNYGGALLNASGEVIGINAGKISRESGEGMGYAFPINSAKDAISEMIGGAGSGESADTDDQENPKAEDKETEDMSKDTVMLQVADPETEQAKEEEETSGEELKENQIAEKETQEAEEKAEEEQPEEETQAEESGSKESSGGTLGVSVGEVSDEYSIIYRVPKGAYIIEVLEGSGAQKAGLRADDIIVRINDTDVTSVAQLKDALSSTRAGDKVKVTYVRPDSNGDYDEDKPANTTVTLQ